MQSLFNTNNNKQTITINHIFLNIIYIFLSQKILSIIKLEIFVII